MHYARFASKTGFGTFLGLVLVAAEARAQTSNAGTPSQPPPALGVTQGASNLPVSPPSSPPLPASPPIAASTPGATPESQAAAQAKLNDPDDRKRVSLTLNPLGLIISRYSFQIEVLPAAHHALTLSPFYTSVDAKTNGANLGSFSGYGAELGYRYYSSAKGPEGFFIGPSFLFSSYKQTSITTANAPEKSFTAIGGAIDLGGQGVIGPGIVLGAGFGLQYTRNSADLLNLNDLNLASAIIAGGGLRPRFLFSVGFAF